MVMRLLVVDWLLIAIIGCLQGEEGQECGSAPVL